MSRCKHAIITGGDCVPYGSTVAYLPDFAECDNPAVPEDKIDDLECGETCPYFEAEDSELITCKSCDMDFHREDMDFTKDCHGITYRLVCHHCYNKLMAKGYDGEYYDERDECLDDDY